MPSTVRAPGFVGLRRSFPDPVQLRAELREKALAVPLPDALKQSYQEHREKTYTDRLHRSKMGGEISTEQRLLQRISLGFNLLELEQIERLGFHEYLEQQLHPEKIDDGGLEDALLEAFPTLSMSPWERLIQFNEEPVTIFIELQLATLYRAIYSPRQLFERMTIFWTDHFNIDLLSDFGLWFKPTDDAEVVRRHALSNFPDLLRASAHSPAMLEYLTNDSNIKGHPNENYARELLELHTLGADRGYTQEDVREVARCLTGWGFYGYRAGERFGRFFFNRAQHDEGRKVVLGQVIPSGGGLQDGEIVLDILATHPNTATFLAEKLLRYFWGYEPGPKAIDQVAETYLETGGDLKAMLRTILTRWRLRGATPKLKRPFHLMVSSVRSLFADLESPSFVLQSILSAGHLPFLWSPPNGYPDAEGYWGGFVLPRWNFASEAVTDPESGLRSDLTFLDVNLSAEELAQRIDLLLSNQTFSESTHQVIVEFLQREPITQARLREAIGLALASPEFQRY